MSIKQLNIWMTAGLAMFALCLSACEGAAKQKGEGKKGAAANDEDGDTAGDGSAVKLNGEADFDGWCEKAGETSVKDDLAKLYGAFCDDGKATKLFTTDLFTVVYDGKGEPKLKSIEKKPISSCGVSASISCIACWCGIRAMP